MLATAFTHRIQRWLHVNRGTQTDTNSNILLCNKAACQVINRSKPDIIGLPITTFLTPSQPEPLLKNNNFELLHKITLDDKTFATNWAPIKIKKKTIASFTILRDITKYKSMSSELERVRVISKKLNAIIESSFDGIYVTDGESKTLRINKSRFENYFGANDCWHGK